MNPEVSTPMTPTAKEMRPPWITRLSMSRPRWSVPRM